MKTKRDLLKALKNNGLPHTYPTLIKYEKLGIIPEPKDYVEHKKRDDRIYSEEEIDNIVSKVKEYKHANI